MKPYLASLINAIALVTLGLYGYFVSESPSATAFIPVGIGTILLVLNPSFKKENKVTAHIAVLLTFIILLGLVMPLRGAISRGDSGALIRVIVMMATTLWALATFIKSFIDVRRSKV